MEKSNTEKWFEFGKALYGGYKEVTKPVKVAKKGVETGMELHRFITQNNPMVLNRLIDGIQSIAEKTPIGQLFNRFYAPHFKLLKEVLKAYGNNNTLLIKDVEQLQKDLAEFSKQADTLIDKTRKPADLLSGPLTYTATVQASKNKTGQFFDGMSYANILYKEANNIIAGLDRLLTVQIKIVDNYNEMYKQAQQALQANKDSATNSIAFASSFLKSHNLELGDLSVSVGSDSVDNQIASLIRNRNDWAKWIGSQPLSRADIYKSE